MHPDMQRMMNSIFSKLTEEQKDDIESQYENLLVLWKQVMEKEEEILSGHHIAAELHLSEATLDGFASMVYAPTRAEASNRLFELLLHVFWFGHLVGTNKWPLQYYKCEEVHESHVHNTEPGH